MYKFDLIYNKVMIDEGGYVSDPDDPGGETYKGISRVNNPKWAGWQIIDSYKGRYDFPKCLQADENLEELVKYLYKKKYYDPYIGDQIDDSIAEEMFDQAVNLGIERAIEHLQRSLNVLNRNQRDYSDIQVDGIFGQNTLKALLKCESVRGTKLLFNVLNGYQVKRYIELMEKDAFKEKYIGWFNRIEIKK
ncbi:MAG TPA: glycosyl hydrolase 108 family protein [Ignavibacteriaceae bacterium]|nr:glycosyl hydrolase 108 family protein [Ignavibacteriaceae bacterium]